MIFLLRQFEISIPADRHGDVVTNELHVRDHAAEYVVEIRLRKELDVQ